MATVKTTFAKNMARIRSHYEYNNKQAANIIGISVESLLAYEASQAEPSFYILEKICKAYGITNVGALLWDESFLNKPGDETKSIGQQTLLEYYYRKLKSPAKEAVNILMGITN